jgi:cyclopropane-fatty-acyl-phospholipid synthase
MDRTSDPSLALPPPPPASWQASSAYRWGSEILGEAGIRINGSADWDIQIHDSLVLKETFSRGNLGLGESYMDGAWDVERLDEFFARLLRSRATENIRPLGLILYAASVRLFNRQTMRRARQVGETHYDLGNEFYADMLDPRMAYTCGYWKDARNLAEAQEAKLDLICRKMGLEPGMRVLDIGCGWGSFMRFAAKRYGVKCVGVTISAEQARWSRERFPDADLDFRLQDYRMLNERFDRIVSIGMFEHVGHKNYRTYMEVAHRCLNDDGLFLLHTIGRNHRGGASDPWIDKYIFPNGELPSLGHIGDAIEGLFVAEDLHNFGADYDKTLMAWHENFERAWPKFEKQLGQRFYRMWRYYLLSCAGAFRARDLQLWQWVLSKEGVTGGYARVS